jgi:hypothetical protein
MGEGITEIRLVLSSCLVHPYFGNAHNRLNKKHKALTLIFALILVPYKAHG